MMPPATELRGQVGQHLGQADSVLVFDPSAFPKSGRESVGVARQWCGRLGKVDNCQVAVYLGPAILSLTWQGVRLPITASLVTVMPLLTPTEAAMTNPLSFDDLQGLLHQHIEPGPDHRKKGGVSPGEWPPLRQAASARTHSGPDMAGAATTGYSRRSHCWASQSLQS